MWLCGTDTNRPSFSFIELPIGAVLKECENTIERIEKARKKLDECTIARWREEYESGIIYCIFKYFNKARKLNDEEIVKNRFESNSRFCCCFIYPSHVYENQYDTAVKIKNMCANNSPEKMVSISADDYNNITYFGNTK